MCRVKFAHTVKEAIYIRSTVCEVTHRAVAKKIKTPKGGKKKNEFLLGSGRHTLLQTLVGALACSGLQMCVTAAWASC
jgi:hypothetical protein